MKYDRDPKKGLYSLQLYTALSQICCLLLSGNAKGRLGVLLGPYVYEVGLVVGWRLGIGAVL